MVYKFFLSFVFTYSLIGDFPLYVTVLFGTVITAYGGHESLIYISIFLLQS